MTKESTFTALNTDDLPFDAPDYKIKGTLKLSDYTAGASPYFYFTFTPPAGFIKPTNVEYNLMFPPGYSVSGLPGFFVEANGVPLGDPATSWSPYQHFGPMPATKGTGVPEGAWFLWSVNTFNNEHSNEVFTFSAMGAVNPSTPGKTGDFRIYLNGPTNKVCLVTADGVEIKAKQ